MRRVSLAVNGVRHELDLEPRELLVYVLRERLGLTGTNVGCDTSSCGACTVHLNGEAVKSCTMLAVQADGLDVRTIEGMADADGTLHPMQRAFQENHGLQCGFCTPGMVMSCAHLVERNPDCTLDDVRGVISGHLCRCGAYPNIIKATLAAAATLRQRKNGGDT